tara:strand:- start:4638 stop:4922 length:285 start_codon:yes stop_codon:yes gene_type:complete
LLLDSSGIPLRYIFISIYVLNEYPNNLPFNNILFGLNSFLRKSKKYDLLSKKSSEIGFTVPSGINGLHIKNTCSFNTKFKNLVNRNWTFPLVDV